MSPTDRSLKPTLPEESYESPKSIESVADLFGDAVSHGGHLSPIFPGPDHFCHRGNLGFSRWLPDPPPEAAIIARHLAQTSGGQASPRWLSFRSAARGACPLGWRLRLWPKTSIPSSGPGLFILPERLPLRHQASGASCRPCCRSTPPAWHCYPLPVPSIAIGLTDFSLLAAWRRLLPLVNTSGGVQNFPTKSCRNEPCLQAEISPPQLRQLIIGFFH